MSDRRTSQKKDHPSNRSSDESWLKSHWRPMMAWQYFAICMFDFLLAPIFFAWFSWFTKTDMSQWQPLTLQGGGLYHLSMGAIIGVTSYAKTQERVAYSNNQTSYMPPQNQFQPNQFGGMGQTTQYSQTTQFESEPQQPIRTRKPKPMQTPDEAQ